MTNYDYNDPIPITSHHGEGEGGDNGDDSHLAGDSHDHHHDRHDHDHHAIGIELSLMNNSSQPYQPSYDPSYDPSHHPPTSIQLRDSNEHDIINTQQITSDADDSESAYL